MEAFAAGLAQRGIALRYDWVLDDDDLRVFYGAESAARKAAVASRALWRRLRSLANAGDVDVWLVQREAFFLGNAWGEWLASRRAPVVFDFDDAIWIRALSSANSRYAWLKNVDKIPRIVHLAHTVIAGNAYLAAWARQHSGNVVVVPTCVDTEIFTPPARARAGGPVVIGWSGSPSTIEHLRPLLPVLERVKARYGDAVRVRVMGDPGFAYPPLALHGEAWSTERELALLDEMDIGLMPLPDDAWTRGKCGLKGLVTMAVGAACVMSPVGVNTEIVEPGVNGYLPASDDEWYDTLCRLVEDQPTRARVGAAGRQTVVSRYAVAGWIDTLASVLRGAGGA
ncbi:MAG: glycosyltransferase family 4 protein [Acidobacteriota bacterium]